MHEIQVESVQSAAPPVYHELPPPSAVSSSGSSPPAPVRPRDLPALRSVVLLSGSVWVSGMRAAVQRSSLDLPVARDQTLLELWWQRVAELRRELARPDLSLRVLVTQGYPSPVSGLAHLPLSVERDAVEYRGTGGALRDLAHNEPADGYILVAHAAQLPLVPLAPIVTRLAGLGADLSVSTPVDGTPGRLMLVRCGCLRVLPRIGFVDLMEQGLRVIAAEHQVRALKSGSPFCLPVRTVRGYITALQRYHRQLRNGAGQSFPDQRVVQNGIGTGDEWQSSFALIEPGADVHPSACIHDAVVLRGARVERDAIVARSVVCPGASVSAHSTVVDQLVSSPISA